MVGQQVQQAFLSGVHYDWAAAEPKDPLEKMLVTVGEEPPARVKLEDGTNLAIVRFEVQAKNHPQKEIKYVDSCVKVYSWICALCTRNKLKTVPGFAETETAKDFIKLNVVIKVVTLQFESNKDLLTALTCSLTRIFKCW